MPRFVSTVVIAGFLFASAAVAASNPKANEALLAAAADGHADKILAALKKADPNTQDEQGNTPLIIMSGESLWGNYKDVIDAFVKAKANIEAKNKEGATALMVAAQYDRWSWVDALIAAGAKVNAKDNDGWTPLMYAALNDANTSAKSLIQAKADVEATDSKGFTALQIALGKGRGSIVEKLMEAGAKFPPKSPDGTAALIDSVYGRDLKGVRIALENNPDLAARDQDGWPALSIASYNDDRQIVMELLRAGADPTLKDKDGKTAIQRATENENKEVVALLGGKWDKPKLSGGTNVSIPCKELGGNVATNIGVDGNAILVTTVFPKPLTYYFGGGNMNRAKSAVKYTYDGSFAPEYEFASGYKLDYSQYGTSVQLNYKDSKGEVRHKNVFANVLSADVKKGEEDVDLSNLSEDERPRATNEEGILRTRVPMSVLGLTPGKPVKMTAKIGKCAPVTAQIALK